MVRLREQVRPSHRDNLVRVFPAVLGLFAVLEEVAYISRLRVHVARHVHYERWCQFQKLVQEQLTARGEGRVVSQSVGHCSH